MAFGTGQHASTRMCIEAIEDIMMKDRSIKEWKVLDVGCGTGILGITAAKIGAQDVICVDIDKRLSKLPAKTRLLIMWRVPCAFLIKMSPPLTNRAI